jgi:hypothetical protein
MQCKSFEETKTFKKISIFSIISCLRKKIQEYYPFFSCTLSSYVFCFSFSEFIFMQLKNSKRRKKFFGQKKNFNRLSTTILKREFISFYNCFFFLCFFQISTMQKNFPFCECVDYAKYKRNFIKFLMHHIITINLI